LRSLFNISATAEASDFKFDMQLGFANYTKIISGRGPGLVELPKIWGFLLVFLQRMKVTSSRLAGRWALLGPIIKSHPEEKENVALGYGSSQKFIKVYTVYLR